MIGAVVFLVVIGFGAVAVAMACRSIADEASLLGEEMLRLGELQPAVVAIRQEAARTADAVNRMRSK